MRASAVELDKAKMTTTTTEIKNNNVSRFTWFMCSTANGERLNQIGGDTLRILERKNAIFRPKQNENYKSTPEMMKRTAT